MIHDEDTVEIEIPIKQEIETSTRMSMVVEPPSVRHEEKTYATPMSTQLHERHRKGQKYFDQWSQELDLTNLWLLRLIAVLTILLLSILVL